MTSVKLAAMTQIEPSYLEELKQSIKDNSLLSEEERLLFIDAVKTPEGLIAYIARVSSPKQVNPKIAGLLKYCATHKHWSIFEQVDITFEIVTSRAISAQLLRHKSLNFQEFSTRYAKVESFVSYSARRQDLKNRQNSIDNLPEETREWFEWAQQETWDYSIERYEKALELGIAKECARFLLPMNTETKLYVKGSLRSWIHYIEVRGDESTQKEHREIAKAIKEIIAIKLPILKEGLEW